MNKIIYADQQEKKKQLGLVTSIGYQREV